MIKHLTVKVEVFPCNMLTGLNVIISALHQSSLIDSHISYLLIIRLSGSTLPQLLMHSLSKYF